MNVFPLDDNLVISATYHVDSHIVKIPLECAQMLSTACRLYGYDVGYQKTHIYHPMSVWVRESYSNYKWMIDYAKSLNEEWKYRFKHTVNHKAFDVIMSLPNMLGNGKLKDVGLTKMPLCMPDHCKVFGDTVASYRKYYVTEKRHLAKWKSRNVPI